MKRLNKPFISIYRDVLSSPHLTSDEKVLLSYLFHWFHIYTDEPNPTLYCPTNHSISINLGMSNDTVTKTLVSLNEKQLIKISPTDDGQRIVFVAYGFDEPAHVYGEKRNG